MSRELRDVTSVDGRKFKTAIRRDITLGGAGNWAAITEQGEFALLQEHEIATYRCELVEGTRFEVIR